MEWFEKRGGPSLSDTRFIPADGDKTRMQHNALVAGYKQLQMYVYRLFETLRFVKDTTVYETLRFVKDTTVYETLRFDGHPTYKGDVTRVTAAGRG